MKNLTKWIHAKDSREMAMSMAGIFLAILVFYGAPPVIASFVQRPSIATGGSVLAATMPTETVSVPEPPTIDLPAGQKFVDIFLPEDKLRSFLTEVRPNNVRPRRLTLYRPLVTGESWEVYLYIQEH